MNTVTPGNPNSHHTEVYDQSWRHHNPRFLAKLWALRLNNVAIAVIVGLFAFAVYKLMILVDTRVSVQPASWKLQLGYVVGLFTLYGLFAVCIKIRPDDKFKQFFVSNFWDRLPK
jgi:hypothetical protein